ncbi:MAG: UDP-3-O-acyl-N-acetylglucosamine deacetylase [Planctomycetota bacterium]
MVQSRKQRTLGGEVAVDGHGYWSGQRVTVRFRPAQPGAGIVFVRDDLGPGARVPADAAHRVDVPRRTNLETGGVQVQMVEHLLAAAYGLGIDNCEIWMNRPEAPGMDGSASVFVDAIDAVGVVEQDAATRLYEVRETFRVESGDAWVEARPHESGGFSAEFRLEYPRGSGVPKQSYSAEITPSVFRKEISTARTFLLKSAAQTLIDQGLGTHVKPTDLLVFGDSGLIGNTLRFDNECARHKTLDVVGDLALAGLDLRARVIASRSGHKLNAELAAKLRSAAQQEINTRAA